MSFILRKNGTSVRPRSRSYLIYQKVEVRVGPLTAQHRIECKYSDGIEFKSTWTFWKHTDKNTVENLKKSGFHMLGSDQ
jgi:hypothetical protein